MDSSRQMSMISSTGILVGSFHSAPLGLPLGLLPPLGPALRRRQLLALLLLLLPPLAMAERTC